MFHNEKPEEDRAIHFTDLRDFEKDEDLSGAVHQVARFCTRCDVEAKAGASLCEKCGDRLVEQGFCPVCEHAWRLPPGTPCPKHEVKLEDAPPQGIPHARGVRWTTVGIFADALKAEAPRIRLEAEGIPTFLEGARMGSPSMYHVATGGVKLQVPQPLLAEARVLLAQSWATPAFEDNDDLDDAWEDLAPEPGTRRRSVMKGTILLILFGPLVLALLAALFGG